jgi:hypothetical protein
MYGIQKLLFYREFPYYFYLQIIFSDILIPFYSSGPFTRIFKNFVARSTSLLQNL